MAVAIVIEARKVYGNVLFYPASESAQAVADIAGSKSISIHDVRRAANAFGAEVIVLNEDIARKAGLYDAPVFGAN